MCHHCGNDCCNNTCCSGDSTIGTGPIFLTQTDSGDVTGATTISYTGCPEKCYFCKNNCIECIQYDNKTLHVCSTHRDALKGRLGEKPVYPYYVPEPITPAWPDPEPFPTWPQWELKY